jgi:hypothetical protein
MASESFAGVDLFSSGPRRYVVEPRGSMVIARLRLNQPISGSVSLGPLEVGVRVVGRLVAMDESKLDGLVSVIEGQLTSPMTVGTLIDAAGREYVEMSFVSFERRGWEKDDGKVGVVEKGRVVSLGYVARFVKVNAI